MFAYVFEWDYVLPLWLKVLWFAVLAFILAIAGWRSWTAPTPPRQKVVTAGLMLLGLLVGGRYWFDPSLTSIPLKIGSYGVMMALGFLCAWYLFRLELVRKALPTELASRITFNAAIWGVIGARVLSLLEEPGRIADHPVKMLVLEGGLTWYGGLAAGTAATIYTILTTELPGDAEQDLRTRIAERARSLMLPVFDAMSPAALVGYAFGRGGCLLSGDGCYGIATGLPWGMAFPKQPDSAGFHCLRPGAIAEWPPVDPSTCLDPGNLATCARYPADVHVHPTPLYEILAGLILFGIVWLLRKKIDRTGMMLGLFFLLGSIPRFFVEFIRLNPRYAGLSLSQWVAIGSFLLGAALIWRSFVRPAPVPAAAAERPAKGRRRRKG